MLIALFAAAHAVVPEDAGPLGSTPNVEALLSRRVDHRGTFGAGRGVTITGGVAYAAGWAVVALSADSYELQKVGYAVTRVGLPVATIGTFVSANALDNSGLRSSRTAATLALPCWSAATVMTSPIDHHLTDNVHELTWFGLELAGVGLTVTQAVLNEVRLADRPRAGPTDIQVEVSAGPDSARLGVSGRF